jgi:hypothetical protein
MKLLSSLGKHLKYTLFLISHSKDILKAYIVIKIVSQLGKVAYAYIPSYVGGKDQDDLCSLPSQSKSSGDSLLIKQAGYSGTYYNPSFRRASERSQT